MNQALNGFLTNILLKQYATGAYVDGHWTDGSETTTTILANIQVASPDEALLLPTGVREKNILRLYTETELKAVDEANSERGDILVIGSKSYRVMKVYNMQNTGIAGLEHYKALVAEID